MSVTPILSAAGNLGDKERFAATRSMSDGSIVLLTIIIVGILLFAFKKRR